MKKLMIASLALGALAFNAPVAQADPTFDFGCNFRAVQQEDATGQNFEGVAWGYIVHPGDATATIRCYISVNDPTGTNPPGGVSSTPWSEKNPSGVGATSGRLTYAAGDTDFVSFHAEVCHSHAPCFVHTYQTVRQQIPPQEVIDQINAVFTIINDIIAEQTEFLDVHICNAFKAAGVPAIINATTAVHGFSMDASPLDNDCDIWDETTDPRSRFIDFSPYGDNE